VLGRAAAGRQNERRERREDAPCAVVGTRRAFRNEVDRK